ncbi:MAG: hypothetical protein HY870_21115 [Chloroflexi bacterium]|nr:hypothetical protein [Chloroflexota bacterium]
MAFQPACLKCALPDRVEKVSVIFANSAAHPALAPRLKPPSEPERPPAKFNLSQNEIMLVLVIGFFTAGIGWVVVALMLWQGWRDKHARYPRLHTEWQAALHHWTELYYCAGCDVVFAPKALPTRSLPAACPQCGGVLRSDEAKWIDAESTVCPWCGSVVKTD